MKTLTEDAAPKLAPIQITDTDKRRLEEMVSDMRRRGEVRDDAASLISELERATVVDSESISDNVVTMGSVVSIIDHDTSESLEFTLVFPHDADPDEDRISILSPIGSAVLGFQVGDEIEWKVPAGMRRFVIAKVNG